MSDSDARRGADANLLYGMLALQMNFVGRDALLGAMQAWVFAKAKSLGQILEEQGRLTSERRQALDQILAEHLKAHDDDAPKSLAALALPGDLRNDLSSLADADVQASLEASADPQATGAYQAAVRAQGGRYQILRLHAKGGLGEVFIALDQEVHREVALKEIQDRFAAHAPSRARFVQEAEITGGLEHPGIVPVYGLGRYPDGRPYYAMRFIRGDSLKEALNNFHERTAHERAAAANDGALQGRTANPFLGMEFRELLRRFIDVCNAVAYAHSRGILHRDLKPSNVMLGKYGETLVVDWGLAKVVGHELAGSASDGFDEATLRPHSGDSSTDTRAGAALGTPSYMSPEQAAGRIDLVGPESDVYGLGATLYALLTGRAPVDGRDPNVLDKVKKGAWPRPRLLRPQIPAALEAICCTALALRAEDRYATPLALAADIEAWLADEPVAAHAEPWSGRVLRWLRRRQKLVTATTAAVVMAALALGAGVVLLTAANDRERHLRGLAQANALQATEQRDEAQRRRDQAWYNLYVATMSLAQREWESGNSVHARDLLDQCVPIQPTDPDHRGWEWSYVDRLCHGDLRVLRGHRDAVLAVAYAPDGASVATAGADGTVRVWKVADGSAVGVLQGHQGLVEALVFSPDGTRLISAGHDAIRAWDLAQGKTIWTARPDPTWPLCLAYNVGGTLVASGSEGGPVSLLDAATGTLVRRCDGHYGYVHGVTFSPDGKRFASGGRDGTVRVWESATGRSLAILRAHTHTVRSVAFSPDGERLASAAEDGILRIWPATGGVPRVLTGRTGYYGVAYHPDGTSLAIAAQDGTICVWDALAGRERQVLRGHTGKVNGLAYSRDGTRLVSAGDDGMARLWDTAAVGGPRLLKGHVGTVPMLVYSPDGTDLTSSGQDATLRFWDTATGKQVKEIHLQEGWINGVAYSPDRTKMAATGGNGTLRLWDLAKGGPPRLLKGHQSGMNDVAFRHDGKRLASVGSDGSVRVWDAETGDQVDVLNAPSGRVLCVAYNPKGPEMAWAGDEGEVHVWDMQRHIEIKTLAGNTRAVLSVAFNPDGTRLASAGADGTVRVWELATAAPPRVFRSHTNEVNRLAFSPDGRRLASAGDDGTVRLWDMARGGEVCVIKNRQVEVNSVAFSPDGTRLAFASVDGTIQIIDGRPWTDASPQEREIQALVEGLFERPLQQAEVLAFIEGHKGISDTVRRQALLLAARILDDPERFQRAARHVVRYHEASPAQYRQVLDWATFGCKLAPQSGTCLTTLGIAQFRTGQYSDALKTLAQAKPLNKANSGDRPAVLAFMALAHLQLNQKKEAAAVLTQLRHVIQQPPHSLNEEALSFLAEVEQAAF